MGVSNEVIYFELAPGILKSLHATVLWVDKALYEGFRIIGDSYYSELKITHWSIGVGNLIVIFFLSATSIIAYILSKKNSFKMLMYILFF